MLSLAIVLCLAHTSFAQLQPQQPPGFLPGQPGISTTPALYTDFDLFKNTKFSPCAINGNISADPTTTDFIVQRDVNNQTDFCTWLAGVPILIPTTATQTAFFPWYPTLIAEAFSLALSYTGLFYTLRAVDRSRMQITRRMPWHFWVQLPFDSARVIAFFFKTIHGFVDPQRFAWTDVVLWLLPLNYIFLSHQMRLAQNGLDEPYAGASQQMAAMRAQASTRLSFADRGLLNADDKAYFYGSQYSAGSNRYPSLRYSAPKPAPKLKFPMVPRGATVWMWIIVTFAMWGLSMTNVILHWKWAWAPGTAFARTYVVNPTAIQDPTTIGNMPTTCLNYLRSGALQQTTFLNQNTDQLMFSLILSLQFLFSSFVLAAIFLGRREPFDRAYLLLYISAAASILLLLLPAIAVGIDLGVKVALKKRVISLRFTNNLQVTGGCTFAYVNMNKRFGYWDVDYERGFRIVMSFLGAS
jgi:hypothetical protein